MVGEDGGQYAAAGQKPEDLPVAQEVLVAGISGGAKSRSR